MKKTLALVMTLLMLVSMTTSVFAAGNFVASPSQNAAPKLIDLDCECDGDMLLYAYNQRDQLPEDLRAEFEACYDEIAAAANLGELNEKLQELANKLKYHIDNLAVSDLFFAHMDGCTVHTGASTWTLVRRSIAVNHGEMTIVLDSEASLDNFAALMNFYDGEWHIVEDATMTDEGYLQFTTNNLGVFAIVVSTVPAQSGDFTTVALVVACAAIACTMVVVLVKTKKRV